MADKLEVYEYDQTWIQVAGDRGIISTLGDYFTYDVPNAKYMPAYQNRLWDGKIRLLDYQTQRIYRGLLPYIQQFCKDNHYDIDIDPALFKKDSKFFDVEKFIKSLGLIYKPYDYQQKAVEHSIKNNRAVLLSPTSSGKSLIIYILLRYYLKYSNKKILICVPTVDLVNQLVQEFKDYAPSYDIESDCHKIYSGQEKQTDKRIVISTWQSVYKMPRSYFKDFETVIIDEAHQSKADSLKGILQKTANAKYRFGLTGTLDDLQYHRLIIEGLTGPVHVVTTTKSLMDRNITSNLTIKCLVLKYNDFIRNNNKSFKYQQEMKFITEYEPRNKFIAKLCQSVKDDKNILILTAYKNHIKLLKEQVEKTGRNVYVVTGDTPTDERTFIRTNAEKENGCVIIATYGVYSTGINIKNLQYMIMASGSKSLIRVLQSIGRGLRRDNKNNKITVIDLIDEFSYLKKRNYILLHFFERIKIYTKEKFKYVITNINI